MTKLIFALCLIAAAIKVAFIATVATVGMYGYLQASMSPNNDIASRVANCAKQGDRTPAQCEAIIAFAHSGAGW